MPPQRDCFEMKQEETLIREWEAYADYSNRERAGINCLVSWNRVDRNGFHGVATSCDGIYYSQDNFIRVILTYGALASSYPLMGITAVSYSLIAYVGWERAT